MTAPDTGLPKKSLNFVIAITGCDGAGKSTLSEDLHARLAPGRSVEWLYLGQSSGNIARWIESLPLLGPRLERYLKSKASKAHDDKARTSSTATTLVIFILSYWRAYKFRRLLSLNRRGTLVITDRYPQAEVPGFHFDGAGLGAINAETWMGKKLAVREQRLYHWMASHLPALIIRLNIDADTAHIRKPDHKLSILQDKVAVLPGLHFNGANILDLDGCDPYPQVLDEALKAARVAVKLLPQDRTQ